VRLWPWVTAFTAASAGTLVYGSLVAANQMVVERKTLRLPRWPKHLSGYRIGLLADLHVRDRYTVALTQRAVEAVLWEAPDTYVIAGDFVGYYKPEVPWLLEEALESFRRSGNPVLGVPGNHDYWSGNPTLLAPVLDGLGIRLLRNEVVSHDGIVWAGIDSYNALHSDPFTTMAKAHQAVDDGQPVVAIWHEPDAVEFLPEGASLMLSGHSHGGQFRLPWGWTPMHTRGGEKYVEGFYPDAPTPVYVSRGLGTTGPPSRLGVLPEVTILTLDSSGF
jgi:predicted MPP superfamily phosphohydrolase